MSKRPLSLVAAMATIAFWSRLVSPGAAGSLDVKFVGTTSKGHRVVLEKAESGGLRVRTNAVCADKLGGLPPPSFIWSTARVFEVPVKGSGTFRVRGSDIKETVDGDSEHVKWEIEGRRNRGGAAKGTIEATRRDYNGQLGDFERSCKTGVVGWRATTRAKSSVAASIPIEDVEVLSASEGRVWAITRNKEIVGIDIENSTITSRAKFAHLGDLTEQRVAFVEGGFWVGSPYGRFPSIVRYEASGGNPTAEIFLDPHSLASGAGALWVLDRAPSGKQSVVRLNAATGKETGRISAVLLDRARPSGERNTSWDRIAVDRDSVWILAGSTMLRLDPKSLRIARKFEVPRKGFEYPVLASASSAAWVIGSGKTKLFRLDAKTGRVRITNLSSFPSSIVADSEGAWVAQILEQSVRRIEGNRVTATIDLPQAAQTVVLAPDGSLWAADRFKDGVFRVDS